MLRILVTDFLHSLKWRVCWALRVHSSFLVELLCGGTVQVTAWITSRLHHFQELIQLSPPPPSVPSSCLSSTFSRMPGILSLGTGAQQKVEKAVLGLGLGPAGRRNRWSQERVSSPGRENCLKSDQQDEGPGRRPGHAATCVVNMSEQSPLLCMIDYKAATEETDDTYNCSPSSHLENAACENGSIYVPQSKTTHCQTNGAPFGESKMWDVASWTLCNKGLRLCYGRRNKRLCVHCIEMFPLELFGMGFIIYVFSQSCFLN